MPLSVRVKGVSLSTATNWAFNWVVGEATPILQERIKWRLYPLHGFFCCLSFIVVYFFFPETKGIPLEEMVCVVVGYVRESCPYLLINISGRYIQGCWVSRRCRRASALALGQ